MTLVPLIDMINHTSSENVTVTRLLNTTTTNNHNNNSPKLNSTHDILDGLQIRAARDISQDEEIGFTYHSSPSRFWICEYGFHPPQNDFDDLDLSSEIADLILSHTDKRGRTRQRWLTREGYWGEYTVSCCGEVSFRIQVAVRTLCCTARDKVRGYLMGERDGVEEQGLVDGVLQGVLEDKVRRGEEVLGRIGKGEDGVEGGIVRTLWEDEGRIARSALRKLAGQEGL